MVTAPTNAYRMLVKICFALSMSLCSASQRAAGKSEADDHGFAEEKESWNDSEQPDVALSKANAQSVNVQWEEIPQSAFEANFDQYGGKFDLFDDTGEGANMELAQSYFDMINDGSRIKSSGKIVHLETIFEESEGESGSVDQLQQSRVDSVMSDAADNMTDAERVALKRLKQFYYVGADAGDDNVSLTGAGQGIPSPAVEQPSTTAPVAQSRPNARDSATIVQSLHPAHANKLQKPFKQSELEDVKLLLKAYLATSLPDRSNFRKTIKLGSKQLGEGGQGVVNVAKERERAERQNIERRRRIRAMNRGTLGKLWAFGDMMRSVAEDVVEKASESLAIGKTSVPQKPYAVKRIFLTNVASIHSAANEINANVLLPDNPHIVKMEKWAYFEPHGSSDEEAPVKPNGQDRWPNVAIAFPLMNGGDLHGAIKRAEFSSTFAKIPYETQTAEQKEDGRIAMRRIAIVIRDIAEGLNTLHKNGMIHHDLKPQNILRHFHTERRTPGAAIYALGDLGCTVILGETLATTSSSGTLEYMDPGILSITKEKGENVIKIAPHSFEFDIWALGAIAYEMAIGSQLTSEPIYDYCYTSYDNVPEEQRARTFLVCLCQVHRVFVKTQLQKKIKHLPPELQSFISKTLVAEDGMVSRLDIDEVLQSPLCQKGLTVAKRME